MGSKRATAGERIVATYTTGCTPGEMRNCYIPKWKATLARRIDAAIARAVMARDRRWGEAIVRYFPGKSTYAWSQRQNAIDFVMNERAVIDSGGATLTTPRGAHHTGKVKTNTRKGAK